MTGSPPSGLSKNVLGIGLVLLSTACFAGSDAMIRFVSRELHPFEIVFLRNLIGFPLLLPFLWRQGRQVLHTHRLPLYLLRAVTTVAAMLTLFSALSLLPLAEFTALTFTVPIFTVIIAVLGLREQIRPHHGWSLGIGFLGMMIILRPGFEAISPGAILTLIGAACLAAAVTTIKLLSRTESIGTIMVYMSLMQIPISILPALWYWQSPSLDQLLWLLLLSIFSTLGQWTITLACKWADLVTLAPFDFSSLIWASLIGYWVFGESADLWTWTGGLVIFISGLLSLIGAHRSATVDQA
jgi:drug/metabolite transporter (DMT)-like permease